MEMISMRRRGFRSFMFLHLEYVMFALGLAALCVSLPVLWPAILEGKGIRGVSNYKVYRILFVAGPVFMVLSFMYHWSGQWKGDK